MNTWQGECSLKDCRQEQEISFRMILVMPYVRLKLLKKPQQANILLEVERDLKWQ